MESYAHGSAFFPAECTVLHLARNKEAGHTVALKDGASRGTDHVMAHWLELD